MKTTGAHINTLLPGAGIPRHLRKVTLRFATYYPGHERRFESREFRATKRELLVVQNRGCWICGTRNHLEVHHFFIEWSLQNMTDWAKFIHDYPQFAKYKTVAAFTDSVDNMRILCVDHHRHVNRGIHCMDYPEWVMQKWIKSGYVYIPAA